MQGEREGLKALLVRDTNIEPKKTSVLCMEADVWSCSEPMAFRWSSGWWMCMRAVFLPAL